MASVAHAHRIELRWIAHQEEMAQSLLEDLLPPTPPNEEELNSKPEWLRRKFLIAMREAEKRRTPYNPANYYRELAMRKEWGVEMSAIVCLDSDPEISELSPISFN